MYRHVVMWQFKEEAEGCSRAENCRKVKDLLDALPSFIPYIRRFETGIGVHQSPTDADVLLISEFDSKADYELYSTHPEHLKVSDYVSKVRSARMVCDYVIGDGAHA